MRVLGVALISIDYTYCNRGFILLTPFIKLPKILPKTSHAIVRGLIFTKAVSFGVLSVMIARLTGNPWQIIWLLSSTFSSFKFVSPGVCCKFPSCNCLRVGFISVGSICMTKSKRPDSEVLNSGEYEKRRSWKIQFFSQRREKIVHNVVYDTKEVRPDDWLDQAW